MTQKMTEEEAIAHLRGCKSSQPGFDEAIRTVCDALEAQRRAVPVAEIKIDKWSATGGLMFEFLGGLTFDTCRPMKLYAAAPAQPAVYQCPRCATSMQVDETAKPAPETAGDARTFVELLADLKAFIGEPCGNMAMFDEMRDLRTRIDAASLAKGDAT